MRLESFGCSLMAKAVNDEPDLHSNGCRLAIELEEQFIAAGWPSGQLFSSEDVLRRRYGVGRRVVIEAIRILEIRGTAHWRRGPSTGLEVAAPDPKLIIEMLRGYSRLNQVSDRHRMEALTFLVSVQRRVAPASRSASVLTFLKDLVQDQITFGLSPVEIGRERLHKHRAGQIVLDMIDQYCDPTMEPGQRIGCESALSARYHADRSITRQALRIMESADLIVSKPGRGNGITTRRPGPGPACRLLCAYLASQQVSVPVTFELFVAMGIEASALAAYKVLPDELRKFQQIFASRWCSGQSARLRDILFTEDALFSTIKNPLIDLCMRSILGYIAIVAAKSGEAVPSEIADCFARNTEQVFQAISRRRPEIAADAHERKLSAIRELVGRYHPQVAQLLFVM